jgi:uncharacterized protein YoxC
MFLETSQDLFLLVASICLIVVSGFLCWLLYEAARFFNQTNALVENIRTKVKMVEDSVIALSEKVSNISQYMGFITEAGQKVMGYLDHKEEKTERPARKTKRKEPTLDEIEESEQEG